VRFDHVVSFSSEDSPGFKAEHLIGNSGSGKKWRCGTAGEGQASVILQTRTPVQINSVHIGNFGSAFVEVLVGRKGLVAGKDGFVGLLPSSSFQDPLEARSEKNANRVKLFTAEKFNKSAATQKWDQVKIVCTQPFNKNIKYGISFLTVTSVEENDAGQGSSTSATPLQPGGGTPGGKAGKTTMLGAFMLKASPNNSDDEDATPKVGNLFASFKAKTPTSADASTPGKISVASEIRQGTLAAMTVKASGLAEVNDTGGFASSSKKDSTKKRKANEPPHQGGGLSAKAKAEAEARLAKKPRPSTDYLNAKLPARNVIDPGIKDDEDDDDKKNRKDRKPETPKPKQVTKPSEPRQPTIKPSASSDKKILSQTPKEKRKASKPFGKLMEGVRFVLSGYQNPQRSEIRDKALRMGATYRGDWDSTCTHLVCAFMNTPKHNQVKAASPRAKIVKASWIEASHRARVRYPWRRHCLDPAHSSQPESEDEVWDEQLCQQQETTAKKPEPPLPDKEEDEMDTDEEIEKVKREEELRNAKKSEKKGVDESNDPYDEDTDDEIEKVREAEKERERLQEELKSLQEQLKVKETKPVVKKEDPDDPYGQDTDDEIENVKKSSSEEKAKKRRSKERNGQTSSQQNKVPQSRKLSQGAVKTETDIENGHATKDHVGSESSSENQAKIKSDPDPVYDADTDVDEDEEKGTKASLTKSGEDKGGADVSLKGRRVLLYGVFNDRDDVSKRVSKSTGEQIRPFLTGDIDLIVTETKWDRNFDQARKTNPQVQFLNADFFKQCSDGISSRSVFESYLIKER